MLVEHPAVVEAAAVGSAGRAQGRVARLLRRARARHRTRPKRCAPSCAAYVADRLGKSFTPRFRAVHHRAAEDPQQQGHAPLDPGGRARPGSGRSLGARRSGRAGRDRAGPMRCADERASRRSVPRRAARAAAAVAQRGLRRLARGASARAGSGSRSGSRCRSPGVPTPRSIPTRSGPAAGRGTASASSTPRTASGCSCANGNQFAGEVSLGNVQRGPFQSAFVGYWIDEAAAGNGYVPEGVVLMLRFAFEELRLHRIEAAIVPRNASEPPRRREARTARRGSRRAAAADPRRLRGPRAVRDHRGGMERIAASSSPTSS